MKGRTRTKKAKEKGERKVATIAKERIPIRNRPKKGDTRDTKKLQKNK